MPQVALPPPPAATQRFAPQEPAALDPEAFGAAFGRSQGGGFGDGALAVIKVRGPLVHHASYWWDSYEAIVERVRDAAHEGAETIVLAIDSPGGLVAGCFEACEAIRAIADENGIELVAYVDGMAASAAYALACSADRIVVPKTGVVGSIGVLGGLVDATKMYEEFGLNVRIISSGQRKSDGHPAVKMSDEAIAAAQARIDDLAETFFGWVAERRGLELGAIRALQGGVLHGAAGVDSGLADEVATYETLIAGLTGDGDDSMKTLARIATILGLSASATESEVIGSLERSSANAEQLRSQLGLPSGTNRESVLASAAAKFGAMVPRAELDKAVARAETAEAAVNTITAQAHAEATTRLLDEAVKAGKVTPASRATLQAMCKTPDGLEQVKAHVATLNPSSLATPTEDPEDSPAARGVLNDAQKHIARVCGISEAEYAAMLTGETKGND